MLFNSVHFLLFFPVVVLLYYVLPQRVRYLWLLVTSYYFYMSWNPKYAILIALSTLITWLSGVLILRYPGVDRRRARLWVGLSFASNLGILFFFKYFSFVLANINVLLSSMGLHMVTPQFDILLPVGISFYTFQALSYTMDVYRGDTKPEKNILRYALYVSFFPQLVAGPIERSKSLLSQLRKPVKPEYIRIKNGLQLMLWGFFKKLVIADNAAIVVDAIYDNYTAYAGLQFVVATLLFAVQIYCDFSGYSDIATGAAGVLGVDLMKNFRQPYFAASVAEFWRRWHISLSTWFRDYLYIPLGGNRKGRLRKYSNLMVTFLVSGLWHGASWHYVIWGGINGAYQVAGDITNKGRNGLKNRLSKKTGSLSWRLFQILLTFVLINVTWVFFRAQSMGQAVAILQSMAANFNPWVLFDQSMYAFGLGRTQFWILIFSILLLFLVDLYHELRPAVRLRDAINRQVFPFRWALYVFGILAVLVFGAYGTGYSSGQFIYFQF